MKNYSTTLFRFFVYLMPFGLWAQDLPNIVPPSPEAASLGKFTEVPISHYTGLPNISVPIASYEVGGKSFPVSINYHARGVRVEEIASRVGIGWTLNAGGIITRQTRHISDDANLGYLDNNNFLINKLADETFFSDDNVRNDYYDNYLQGNPQELLDRIPDNFMIQAGSLSGKFIFDYKNGGVLQQKFSDMKIETSSNGNGIIDGFIVTDKDGFKYYFGFSAYDYDKVLTSYTIPMNGAMSYTGPTQPIPTYNTWHLMKIESPSGELVRFYYSLERPEFFRRSYDENTFGGGIINYTNEIESNQYQLDSIVHSLGTIKFVKEVTERSDLKLGFALDKIEILDNNDNLVKTYDLNQSYQSTEANSIMYTNGTLMQLESQASSRLFLDSIVEIGKNNVAKPATEFTYNSQKLPNRFSNAQDFWGYYNGAQNGQFLTILNYYYYPVHGGSGYAAAAYSNRSNNRAVDTLKSMAGMLERVKYPTGGTTKFVYEHNKGILGNEFDGIDLPQINPIGLSGASIGQFSTYDGDKYSKDVDLSNIVGSLMVNINLDNLPGNQDQACANPLDYCQFSILLHPINGNTNPLVILYTNQTEYASIPPGEYRLEVNPNESYFNGWNTDPMHPTEPYYFFSVNLSWDEGVDVQEDLVYAAGKRIKRIEFYDNYDPSSSGNIPTTYREYAYISSGTDPSPSGKILGLSSFVSIRKLPYNNAESGHPINPTENINFVEPLGSIPGSPLSSYQGNTIGYENVIEYIGDKNNNIGRTDYSFTIFKDSGAGFSNINGDSYMSFPYHPPNDMEWLRGLPKSVTHYKNEGGTFVPVKKSRTEYIYGGQEFDPGLNLYPSLLVPQTERLDLDVDMTDTNKLYHKDDIMYRLPLIHVYYQFSDGAITASTPLFYKTYHMTGGTVDPYYITETSYDENGNETVVVQTNNAYDYSKHYQPKNVITETSDGKSSIQIFTYPQDLLSSSYLNSNPPVPSTIEDHLDFQNKVVPIEVKSYKDLNDDGIADSNELLSTKKTNYDWDSTNSHILEPISVQTSKETVSLKDRVFFKRYDADGNILQVAKADGIDITYIYGYNNSLPVAKIENATYSQILGYVGGIQSASNADNDRCQDSGSCNEKALRSVLNTLRTNFPDAMITTYTYDPLIGVTSITDPRGYTVYYEYDDLHRLERVIDQDGNIMSENKYHYMLDN
ncbi:RHS repeat domain-containing protein [Winogradskyella sp. MIT101101]|uniref:RHS repeat protein n=1 Tax=Winogradskyella sp. MIT101101 TaxID=3098297 RepID=UPI0039996FF4